MRRTESSVKATSLVNAFLSATSSFAAWCKTNILLLQLEERLKDLSAENKLLGKLLHDFQVEARLLVPVVSCHAGKLRLILTRMQAENDSLREEATAAHNKHRTAQIAAAESKQRADDATHKLQAVRQELDRSAPGPELLPPVGGMQPHGSRGDGFKSAARGLFACWSAAARCPWARLQHKPGDCSKPCHSWRRAKANTSLQHKPGSCSKPCCSLHCRVKNMSRAQQGQHAKWQGLQRELEDALLEAKASTDIREQNHKAADHAPVLTAC